ncbi:MAG: site-specific recombinase [Bacteroidia bacterium]|jgi:site-specific recombinase|nr:site-specific recombinase [Bacteroidia bacterium]
MTIEFFFEQLQQNASKHPNMLRELFKQIAVSKTSFNKLIQLLTESESARLRLKYYIERVFAGKDITYLLIEAGIPKRTGFGAELKRKLKHTFLPEEIDKSAVHYLLDFLTHSGRYELSKEQLHTLLGILELKLDFTHKHLQAELIDAIEVLSYRITATAIESEFIQKFKNNQKVHSFIKLNKEINALIAQHTLGIQFNPHLVQHIQQMLQQALGHIDTLQKQSNHEGVSLQLTYSLNRITHQIKRLNILFELYASPKLTTEQVVTLLTQLFIYNKKRNSIIEQLNETTYLLAQQITEHESNTGEHYIAENQAEYKGMFRSSCIGGVFASLMTLFKIGLHHLHLAPFWQAFGYSINYASGFVGIQLTHGTLATKQPAMTASRIALSLHKKDQEGNSILGLALMIGQVSRSQFISLVGNLMLVFPLSFVIAFAYNALLGKPIVNQTEASKMLHDVHPFANPTWYYACITGVFLFISGIISGYYDNKVIYSHIPNRIRQHPLLKRLLTKRALIKLSAYVNHNLGSIIGNIFLGFCLGMASFFGFIFGLPIDIRHITISSGNYAIALCTLWDTISIKYALVCLVGVLGIGFFNLLVSFGLAIVVAARSRKLALKEFTLLLRYVGKYAKKYPADFFIPPKNQRNTEDIYS